MRPEVIVRSSLTSMVFGLIAFTVAHAIDHASSPNKRDIAATLLWTFELEGTQTIRFGENAMFKHHGSLAQAVPYGEKGVVLYDSIENKIMMLDQTGVRIWAAGQPGDGPEDHRQPCEVRLNSDGGIVLVSLWPPTKVVYYDDSGAYIDSWQLPGLRDSQRVVYSGNNTYVISTESSYIADKEGDTEMEYVLTTIDEDGLPRARKKIKTSTFRKYHKGMVVHEEDLWTIPRIEAGPRGTLLVQEDLFAPDVEVYDRELNLIARIEGDWNPPTQTDEYKNAMLERTKGAKVAAPTVRALRHLFSYANQEIWLQRPDDRELVFAAYDITGQALGEVRITSLAGSDETLVLLGDHLLTFEEDEDGSNSGVRQTFRLFKLH